VRSCEGRGCGGEIGCVDVNTAGWVNLGIVIGFSVSSSVLYIYKCT
jgi:hypothetical protein